jgi:tetratricopeptide (TPR) repeat protein
MAEREGVHLCILSGEFGLVDWDEPIPWYDHLLIADEVPQLAQKVERQIAQKGITRVEYYTVSPQVDPKIVPYLNVIENACRSAGAELTIYTLDEPKLASTVRNWKRIMEWAAEARQTLIKDEASGAAEFNNLLSLFPDDGMIFFERANGYETLGKLELAKADYERAKDRFPLERWQ